jgi:hypothetical protein
VSALFNMEQRDKILSFITNSNWTFAKTMPQWPHYYIVRDAQNKKEFVEFVEYIRANGKPEPFLDKKYIYFEIDGWKYWTMGNPIEETTIINRCKPEGS